MWRALADLSPNRLEVPMNLRFSIRCTRIVGKARGRTIANVFRPLDHRRLPGRGCRRKPVYRVVVGRCSSEKYEILTADEGVRGSALYANVRGLKRRQLLGSLTLSATAISGHQLVEGNRNRVEDAALSCSIRTHDHVDVGLEINDK